MSLLGELVGEAWTRGALRVVTQPLRAATWVHLRGGACRDRRRRPRPYAARLARELRHADRHAGAADLAAEVSLSVALQGSSLEVRGQERPTAFGPAVTLRLPSRAERLRLGLEALGFEPSQAEALRAALSCGGVVMVHGRSQSGRSAVLYSLLRELARRNRLVFTAEHVVHRVVPGVRQCEVDWPEGLRGEGRESPQAVARGALRSGADALFLAELWPWFAAGRQAGELVRRGALVLVNARTHGDVGGAAGELAMVLGADALRGAPLTLVRTLRLPAACPGCRHEAPAPPGVAAALGLTREVLDAAREGWPRVPERAEELPAVHAPGCAACQWTGARWSLGAFEVHQVPAGIPGDPGEALRAVRRGPTLREHVLHALARRGVAWNEALWRLGSLL